MKLLLQDVEIPINRKDVLLARSAVNTFLETTRAGSEIAHSSSLYFTTLLMMYKKSTELLHELGVDNLRAIMEMVNGEED